MRERIACKTCKLRDKCNDLYPIVGVTPVDKGRPRMDICEEQLKEADNLLTLICEEIEKVENPYMGSRSPKHIDYGISQQPEFGAFEDCRLEILSLLRSEE